LYPVVSAPYLSIYLSIYLYIYLSIFIYYKERKLLKYFLHKYISLYPSRWIHGHGKGGLKFLERTRNHYFQNAYAAFPLYFLPWIFHILAHTHPSPLPTKTATTKSSWLVITLDAFLPHTLWVTRLVKGWRDVSSMQQFQFSNYFSSYYK